MKKYASFFFLFFFFYLLLAPQSALDAAREGLLLWYHSILPALFPFMLLCTLALRLGLLDCRIKQLYRPFHLLTGCSSYGAFVIFAGFLCGFPMGAKITHDLQMQKKISQEEANWLLGFVNNLSPGFLISYAACEQLAFPSGRLLLPLTVLGSSLLYGVLTSSRHRHTFSQADPNQADPYPDASDLFPMIDDCINSTILSVVRLGAYILMFTLLRSILYTFLPSAHPITVFLCAILEVTGGIHLIAASSLPFAVRYILVNVLCCFGGLCALAQTAGIASMNRHTLLHYTKSRVMITLLSVLISCASFLFCFFF